MCRCVLTILVALLLAGPLTAQTASGKRDFLIEPNRPIAYLHVDHVGLGQPEEDGKRHLRVWLELHNNCALPIRVRTYGAPAGDSRDAIGVMDEIVPRRFLELELLTPDQERELGPKKKMPTGTWFDVGSTDRIEPGAFLSFSLPANHFGKRWDIHIPFSFDLPPGKGPRDDKVWGGYVETFLSYSFYDLPESIQKDLTKVATHQH